MTHVSRHKNSVRHSPDLQHTACSDLRAAISELMSWVKGIVLSVSSPQTPPRAKVSMSQATPGLSCIEPQYPGPRANALQHLPLWYSSLLLSGLQSGWPSIMPPRLLQSITLGIFLGNCLRRAEAFSTAGFQGWKEIDALFGKKRECELSHQVITSTS